MILQSICCWTFLVTFGATEWFIPRSVLSCLFRAHAIEYLKSHWEQLNGLSPVWVLSSLFRAPAIEHWKSHWQQLNDLSPMRVLSCFIKALAVEHLVTLGATKWFIPSLGSFVSLQSTCCWTFLVTLGATEWFIPRSAISCFFRAFAVEYLSHIGSNWIVYPQ